MRKPTLLRPDRLRDIRQTSFGWVDHNFLHHGYLRCLTQDELLLYYFLITVADRHGVSFYDYERICQWLKMELDPYLRARHRLCERSLIAYQEGLFQVLSLPARAEARLPVGLDSGRSSTGDFQTLKEVLNRVRYKGVSLAERTER